MLKTLFQLCAYGYCRLRGQQNLLDYGLKALQDHDIPAAAYTIDQLKPKLFDNTKTPPLLITFADALYSIDEQEPEKKAAARKLAVETYAFTAKMLYLSAWSDIKSYPMALSRIANCWKEITNLETRHHCMMALRKWDQSRFNIAVPSMADQIKTIEDMTNPSEKFSAAKELILYTQPNSENERILINHCFSALEEITPNYNDQYAVVCKLWSRFTFGYRTEEHKQSSDMCWTKRRSLDKKIEPFIYAEHKLKHLPSSRDFDKDEEVRGFAAKISRDIEKKATQENAAHQLALQIKLHPYASEQTLEAICKIASEAHTPNTALHASLFLLQENCHPTAAINNILHWHDKAGASPSVAKHALELAVRKTPKETEIHKLLEAYIRQTCRHKPSITERAKQYFRILTYDIENRDILDTIEIMALGNAEEIKNEQQKRQLLTQASKSQLPKSTQEAITNMLHKLPAAPKMPSNTGQNMWIFTHNKALRKIQNG